MDFERLKRFLNNQEVDENDRKGLIADFEDLLLYLETRNLKDTSPYSQYKKKLDYLRSLDPALDQTPQSDRS